MFPLALLLGSVAAGWASRGDLASSIGLWWLAWVLWAAVRFLLAIEAESAPKPALRERWVGRLEVALLAEPLLWAVLLLVLAPAAVREPALGTAVAGSLLLAALARPARLVIWRVYLGAWAGLLLALAALSGEAALVSLLMLGGAWLLAAWLARPPVIHQATAGVLADGKREGFQRALAAMPVPVIVVRAGRIVDLNSAAAGELRLSRRELMGSPLAAYASIEPAAALQVQRGDPPQRSARLRLLAGAGERSWVVEVRSLRPGVPQSPLMLALLPASRPEPAQQARHLAEWLAGQGGRPWHRDHHGRLALPPEFARAGIDGGAGFPLAALLVRESERSAVEQRWLAAQSAGRVFDETLELIDACERPRLVRVTALIQAGADEPRPAVLGVLAAPAASYASDMAGAARLLSRMPVLVWLVDASGRVLHAQGGEPARWGLMGDLGEQPHWEAAFDLAADALADLGSALARAAAGQPVFDLLHARNGRAGARLLLRSHFIPYQEPGLNAVLVLDTIASPAEARAVERLKQSKAQYKALVEASTSLVWACDAQLNLSFVSRRAAREMYGRDNTELLGLPLAALAPPELDQPELRAALEQLRAGHRLRNLEVVHVNGAGQHIVVSMSAAPLRWSDGRFAGAIGMNSDLTAMKKRESRLAEALRVERTVLDSAGQAIAVVKQGRVQRCNDAFLRLSGLSGEALAQRPVVACFASPAAWAEVQAAAERARPLDQAIVREIEVRRAQEREKADQAWCQLTARAIGPEEYVLVLADIDSIRRREQSARHDALHDELTGLPNRRHFAERAQAALSMLASHGGNCALLAIDLDGFKQVNDREGHDSGDVVLREIARRLASIVRADDTVARRGGDEFAILVPQVASLAEVEHIAERLLRVLAQPVVIDDRRIARVTASVGVALAPEHGRDFERVFQLADLAMYEAKLRGKNCWALAQGAVLSNVTPLKPRATQGS